MFFARIKKGLFLLFLLVLIFPAPGVAGPLESHLMVRPEGLKEFAGRPVRVILTLHGSEIAIEEWPATAVVFLIEQSGAMHRADEERHRVTGVINALGNLKQVNEWTPEKLRSQAAVLIYSGGINAFPRNGLTSDIGSVIEHLESYLTWKLPEEIAPVNIQAAMTEANHRLSRHARLADMKKVICFSSAEQIGGAAHEVQDRTIESAVRDGIRYHTFGLGHTDWQGIFHPPEESLLGSIARATGGGYRLVNDPAVLEEAVGSALQEGSGRVSPREIRVELGLNPKLEYLSARSLDDIFRFDGVTTDPRATIIRFRPVAPVSGNWTAAVETVLTYRGRDHEGEHREETLPLLSDEYPGSITYLGQKREGYRELFLSRPEMTWVRPPALLVEKKSAGSDIPVVIISMTNMTQDREITDVNLFENPSPAFECVIGSWSEPPEMYISPPPAEQIWWRKSAIAPGETWEVSYELRFSGVHEAIRDTRIGDRVRVGSLDPSSLVNYFDPEAKRYRYVESYTGDGSWYREPGKTISADDDVTVPLARFPRIPERLYDLLIPRGEIEFDRKSDTPPFGPDRDSHSDMLGIWNDSAENGFAWSEQGRLQGGSVETGHGGGLVDLGEGIAVPRGNFEPVSFAGKNRVYILVKNGGEIQSEQGEVSLSFVSQNPVFQGARVPLGTIPVPELNPGSYRVLHREYNLREILDQTAAAVQYITMEALMLWQPAPSGESGWIEAVIQPVSTKSPDRYRNNNVARELFEVKSQE